MQILSLPPKYVEALMLRSPPLDSTPFDDWPPLTVLPPLDLGDMSCSSMLRDILRNVKRGFADHWFKKLEVGQG